MIGDQYRLNIMQTVTRVTDDPTWSSLFYCFYDITQFSLILKMFKHFIIFSIWGDKIQQLFWERLGSEIYLRNETKIRRDLSCLQRWKIKTDRYIMINRIIDLNRVEIYKCWVWFLWRKSQNKACRGNCDFNLRTLFSHIILKWRFVRKP